MRLDLIWQIARKELLLFFASPIAYLVLGAFLAITLLYFSGDRHFLLAILLTCAPCSSGYRLC